MLILWKDKIDKSLGRSTKEKQKEKIQINVIIQEHEKSNVTIVKAEV